MALGSQPTALARASQLPLFYLLPIQVAVFASLPSGIKKKKKC
jgi:hypothetical protein